MHRLLLKSSSSLLKKPTSFCVRALHPLALSSSHLNNVRLYSTTATPEGQKTLNTEAKPEEAKPVEPATEALQQQESVEKNETQQPAKTAEQIKQEQELEMKLLQDRQDMEKLLRQTILRGLRATILFVVAITAFIFATRKKADESTLMKYLEKFRSGDNNTTGAANKEQTPSQKAIEKTEQLKKAMKEVGYDPKDSVNENFVKQTQQKQTAPTAPVAAPATTTAVTSTPPQQQAPPSK